MDINKWSLFKLDLFKSRKLHIYLLILISIIGTILRFYKLGAQSFWSDEASSIFDAQGRMYNVSHPPFSYVILRIFLEIFGTNEFTARLPSCLFGIATIPLVYFFGKLLFSEKEGLVASFIIAVSPWYIRWSQEARMYTELTVFAILALFFFYKGTIKENIKLYIVSTVFVTLAFYTHYAGFTLIPISLISLILAGRTNERRFKMFWSYLASNILFVISVILLFLVIQDIFQMANPFEQTRWALPSITNFLFILFSNDLGSILSIFSILGAIYLILKKDRAGYLLIIYALFPLFMFSVLVLTMNIAPRYVIFTLPAYALLTSHLLIEVFEKTVRSEIDKESRLVFLRNMKLNKFLAVGFLLATVVSVNNISSLYYYYSYGVHPDWRTACTFVKNEMNQEDIIVTTIAEPVLYYLDKVDFELIEQKIISEIINELKNSREKVWLLIDDWRIGRIDPDYEFRNWLNSDCENMKQVYLITVYLFTP